jgi:hypothetical protein
MANAFWEATPKTDAADAEMNAMRDISAFSAVVDPALETDGANAEQHATSVDRMAKIFIVMETFVEDDVRGDSDRRNRKKEDGKRGKTEAKATLATTSKLPGLIECRLQVDDTPSLSRFHCRL